MQTIIDEPGGVSTVRVSPDGLWLAFDSTMAGQYQVYATSISGKGARVAVTERGGQSPRWSRDGRQLFFRRGGALFAVDAAVSGADIHFGPEREMFKWDVAREYDVAASGEFYSLEPVPGAAHQTSIQLKTGWFAEVDRLVRRPAR
jgi:dipeptidyl aminopeptidase/acylaminoacyl peptidase